MKWIENYLTMFRCWYDKRPLREQALTLFLFLSVTYALFYFLFSYKVDSKILTLKKDIYTTQQKVNSWKQQIDTLNKIATTPLYKKWAKHHEYFDSLKKQYHFLLKNSSSKEWQEVITTLLKSEPNITLLQITSSPESTYSPTGETTVNKIYEQAITLSIQSDYFSTLDYIKKLESVLPNIHWKKLSYTVTEYPKAKVDLEFSIFYEKTT